LLADHTDRPADEQALARWFEGLPVMLNLIPYNPIAAKGAEGFVPTAKAEREAFAARFRARGIQTTLRRSLGGDISAACGQLARRPT